MDYYNKYLKYRNKYLILKNDISNHVFSEYDTKEKRKNKMTELFDNKIKFDNKIYIIGFGAVGRPLLWLLLKMLDINPLNITIIDEKNILNDVKNISPLKFNVKSNIELTEYNYREIFAEIEPNDIIIDAAVSINSFDMIKFCQEVGASYINSALSNEWAYTNKESLQEPPKTLTESIYHVHKTLEELNKSFDVKNSNCIIGMGCNPGNVSLWTKIGLLKIAQEQNNNNDEYDANLFKKRIKYNKLARQLGVQVIHISEKDTQIINNPKKMNEYCNTWSGTSLSYYDEAIASVELSLGTHEPRHSFKNYLFKNNEYLILKQMGLYTYAQSWIPFYNKFIGNLICHDESYTIGKTLTIYNKNNNKIIYKPSIYYVYQPCNAAILSIEELKERNEKYQDNTRLLTSEIINGNDILGLTYFLKNKKIYWIGSTLGINETRDITNNEINNYINATLLQVIVGYMTGIIHIINLNNNDIKKGLMEPDDLPVDDLIQYQLPFLGDFIFVKKSNYKLFKINNNVNSYLNTTTKWTFKNFLI